jgi:hypothetical protein
MRSIFILGVALLSAPAAAQSGMSKAEATQLYTAAGFPIVANRPTNRCGAAASPGTRFVDLNGDRRPEVLFVDANPACYKEGATYFAILTKDSAIWRLVASGEGAIKAKPTRTGGWFDMTVTARGVVQELAYDGSRYSAARSAAGTPPASQASVGGNVSAIAWKLPKKAASLTAAERNALFRSAGFVQRGGEWKGCDGGSDASIDDESVNGGAIQDLNGDGRPEVIVTDQGTACYGMTGTGFHILTAGANGWRVFWSSPGIPTILPARGAGGWPNIEVGGPGFCMPVYGWDGRAYDIRFFNEYDKGACRRMQVAPGIPVRPAKAR